MYLEKSAMANKTNKAAKMARTTSIGTMSPSCCSASPRQGAAAHAISPGFIDSGSAPPGELAGMAKRVPAGYIGEVKDTVSAVRFLLSDDARYVNGANIQVSGGWGI